CTHHAGGFVARKTLSNIVELTIGALESDFDFSLSDRFKCLVKGQVKQIFLQKMTSRARTAFKVLLSYKGNVSFEDHEILSSVREFRRSASELLLGQYL